ncbi:MAG: alanine racemase, partial [Pseudomonadota bacterium]
MRDEVSDQKADQTSARTRVVVDLDAIVANWRQLADLAEGATAAVVKANGYGCGATPVARALAAAGCETFFVASLAEGEALRADLPRPAIYVLDGYRSGQASAFAEARLRPVISSPETLAAWFGESAAANAGYALHVDTGMSRLGAEPEQTEELRQLLHERPAPQLIMTHPACADAPANPMTLSQSVQFDAICDALGPSVAATARSFANSAALIADPHFHYDVARPGIALYGGRALEDRPNPMRQAVRLDARVLQLRTVAAGTPVGYGSTFVTERVTRLATLAVGYADGLPRALGNASDHGPALVEIADTPCPVVGRI